MGSRSVTGVRRTYVAVLLLGVAGLGVAATVLAIARSQEDARRDDQRIADAAADSVRAELLATTSSLAGGDALAADGVVTTSEFAAFGADVLQESGLAALAFAEPVLEADRDAWELRTGLSVKDTDGQGGFRDASVRDRHVVVVAVSPVNEATTSVLGFDLLSDPTRADAIMAADASETSALVGPIRLATSADGGLFVARAVRDADGTTVGYLSSGFALTEALSRIADSLGVEPLALLIDGTRVDGRPDAGGSGEVTSSFSVGGRTLTITSARQSSTSYWLPLALGMFSAILCLGATGLLRRERNDRRTREADQVRSERLRELAESLASTTSTAQVMSYVANHSGAVVGAAHTNVGRRTRSDPSKLEVIHDGQMPAELAEDFAMQALDASLPLTDAARTGRTVVIANQREYQARYPHVMPQVDAAGIRSVICVPLSLGDDRSVGVIGLAFDRGLRPAEVDELVTTAGLVAQMTGRAFERALTRELIEGRVALLGDFTAALTAATTVGEVVGCVSEYLAPVLDLDDATLAPTAEAPQHPKVRTYPSSDGGGLALHLTTTEDRNWTSTEENLARTIADLVQAALIRARLHDDQHAVLVRFQESLLTAPADIEGFDVGVGYRPALGTIGIGGDWYSVVDTPDRIYAVVGDVAGHGASAIAVMAEVKSVLRHLLSTHTPIGEALHQANLVLLRRDNCASAVIVEIERDRPVARYVNAGHLPTLICRGGVVELLEGVHRPWLGVTHGDTAEPTEFAFASGDALMLYTDGLVEERGESIDVGIERLASDVDLRAGAQHAVDVALASRERRTNLRTVNDDIAAVVLCRH